MKGSALMTQTDVLAEIARAAEDAGVFGAVRVAGTRLDCEAKASAEPASYRVDVGAEGPTVSLVTPARYLSQSIEADLVHTGDKLDDLLADELVDQGYGGPGLRVEHYRDPEKMFTFLVRVPVARAGDAAELARVLLAFEACFRPLGDMEAGEG